MLDLHYWPTPNGKKVTIQLEECGLDYQVIPCNIGQGDQFTDDFLAINPNNRMPTLVDHAPEDGQGPLSVFESGAMMLYLAEKTGQFMPKDPRGKFAVVQWVMWQMANQGPKTGECGHFRRLGDSEGDQSYAITRFTDEVNRFYGVLNNQLYRQPYLCGDDYTIADMICYPWCVNWAGQGQDIWRLGRRFEMTRPHCQMTSARRSRRCFITSAHALLRKRAVCCRAGLLEGLLGPPGKVLGHVA